MRTPKKSLATKQLYNFIFWHTNRLVFTKMSHSSNKLLLTGVDDIPSRRKLLFFILLLADNNEAITPLRIETFLSSYMIYLSVQKWKKKRQLIKLVYRA